MADGMCAIGRFGIGFFSVFMLGDTVRVYSRRCDLGVDSGRLLEFRGGTTARPVLLPMRDHPMPVDGGTRIEVLLKVSPQDTGGLLESKRRGHNITLSAAVGALAPNLDVAIDSFLDEGTKPITRRSDWLTLPEQEFLSRMMPLDGFDLFDLRSGLLQPILDKDGQVYGRAAIHPGIWAHSRPPGWVTISGLRASPMRNIAGVIFGETLTASRDNALPTAPKEALTTWASAQANLISTVKDASFQANAAEVILAFEGNISNLKNWVSLSLT